MKDIIFIIKKNKILILVTFIIWLFIEYFLIAPIAYTLSLKVELTQQILLLPENISKANTLFLLNKVNGWSLFLNVTLFFSIFLFICLFIGIFKNRKKSEYDKIEHGSSDWAENGEQYRILSKNKGIILAEKNYLPLDKSGNTNVLIVGGSGAGKSSAYTIPNAFQSLGSYIFTDPKGEIYDITAGYLKSQGYDIKILNLVNPKSSDCYNPIEHIQSEIDVDVISSTIIKGQKSDNSNSDPYWDNMAELLLKSLIYYLLALRPKEEQNLASCAELVRAANNNDGDNLVADLIKQLPDDHPAKTNFKSVALASDKTYSSILSTLQSKLGKFDSKDIAALTSVNTINFDEIVTKKTALYVVSSDTHTAYDFLLTIFFSQMIQHLYDFADKNNGKLPIPAYFILDEFANIGQIPDFDKKISTSRSRGISFSVILQNLDQLKAIYDKSYETIIGNCDTHIFLGSNSFSTVEYFSKELGQKTISHNSTSINRNNSAVKTGSSESTQILARALMTPDELRRMDPQECIIFEKGLKPIKAKKYFWYTKKKIVSALNSNKLNHNDYSINSSQEWRKWNMNNLYSSPNNPEISLDNLLDNNSSPEIIEKDLEPIIIEKPEETNIEVSDIDITKELENKFNELFGSDND